MIGVLAAVRAPQRFDRLVLVAPSPCHVNDGAYVGGYDRADVDALLEFLDDNFVAWSNAMAPAIVGNPDRPQLGRELARSFCRVDPDIARQFARVTFLADNRPALDKVRVPSLILQCASDALAPLSVGDYMHRAMHDSTLVRMAATGHCPNLSAPEETIAAIRAWLD
jgi:sigma-B regulation protein RsbQ